MRIYFTFCGRLLPSWASLVRNPAVVHVVTTSVSVHVCMYHIFSFDQSETLGRQFFRRHALKENNTCTSMGYVPQSTEFMRVLYAGPQLSVVDFFLCFSVHFCLPGSYDLTIRRWKIPRPRDCLAWDRRRSDFVVPASSYNKIAKFAV